MANFSNKQLVKFLRYSGVPKNKCEKNNEAVNIYKLLHIQPKLNEDGSRQITPYEILGVPPVFVDGKEKPIVFSIKNRAKKLGKYEGTNLVFFYKSHKVQEEKDLLETLKSNYRRAVFYGDKEQAESLISMILDISSDEAHKLISSFYDYHKFYRSMKKQLLIDLFSHFFLMYLRSAMKSVKRGLVRSNKLYKPFKDERSDEIQEENEGPFIPDIAMDPAAFGLGNIQNISVQGNEETPTINFDFKNKEKSAHYSKLNEVSHQPKIEVSEVTEKTKKPEVPEQIKPEKVEPPNLFEGKNHSLLKRKKRLFGKHFGLNYLLDDKPQEITEEKQEDKNKKLDDQFEQKYFDETGLKYE